MYAIKQHTEQTTASACLFARWQVYFGLLALLPCTRNAHIAHMFDVFPSADAQMREIPTLI